MSGFEAFLDGIEDPGKRERLAGILEHIAAAFPSLKKEIKWHQPMFTDHGTFIIAFSVARHHIAAAPEKAALERFDGEIRKAGYERTKELFKIEWNDPVDFGLLDRIIAFNIDEKKDVHTFWRQ